MNKEEYDFNEFMAKLAHKVKEVQDDYNKLSYNNKAKVNETVKKIFQAKGIVDIANFFSRFN